MKFKDKKDFIDIARELAWINSHKHSYIPDTKGQMQYWTPHEWVLQAMEDAYIQGLEDAIKIKGE